MATNFFFNNYQDNAEQNLLEDLIIETIQQFGYDFYYIPRVLVNQDEIYGEDTISEYNNSYMIEMYVKNVEGFGGEGDFFSKFEMQIRDTFSLSIAKRRFLEEIGRYENRQRPYEGDLVYFPMTNDIFKINFVEHEAVFYALGNLNTFDITLEEFEYSSEILNTGIDAIDRIERELSLSTSNYNIKTEDNLVLVDEDGFPIIQEAYSIDEQSGDLFADNDEIQEESDAIIDFSEHNPFSESW